MTDNEYLRKRHKELTEKEKRGGLTEDEEKRLDHIKFHLGAVEYEHYGSLLTRMARHFRRDKSDD